LVAYISENPWILASILIIGGFIMTFFGGKFLPWVVAIFSGFASFLIVMLLCSALGMLNYIEPN
jgi:uncharacterized membrane protein YjjP (DUF1212 family)